MRRMWFAAVAFLLIIVLCICERFISDAITDEISCSISYAEQFVKEGEIEQAMLYTDKAQQIWNEKQKIMFLFVPHNQYNNFEEYINSLDLFLKTEDYNGFLIEAKRAQENLKHINNSNELNLENIL